MMKGSIDPEDWRDKSKDIVNSTLEDLHHDATQVRRHRPRCKLPPGEQPPAQGLYDPALEHDSCGVGFVANMKNAKSHDIIVKGLNILRNLDHRGAVGADPKAGDGCGILTQIPHEFFAAVTAALGFDASRRRPLRRGADLSAQGRLRAVGAAGAGRRHDARRGPRSARLA